MDCLRNLARCVLFLHHALAFMDKSINILNPYIHSLSLSCFPKIMPHVTFFLWWGGEMKCQRSVRTLLNTSWAFYSVLARPKTIVYSWVSQHTESRRTHPGEHWILNGSSMLLLHCGLLKWLNKHYQMKMEVLYRKGCVLWIRESAAGLLSRHGERPGYSKRIIYWADKLVCLKYNG